MTTFCHVDLFHDCHSIIFKVVHFITSSSRLSNVWMSHPFCSGTFISAANITRSWRYSSCPSVKNLACFIGISPQIFAVLCTVHWIRYPLHQDWKGCCFWPLHMPLRKEILVVPHDVVLTCEFFVYVYILADHMPIATHSGHFLNCHARRLQLP